MKRMKLSELTGNEILAQSLMTWDYQIILPEGAVLKKEYIDKIEEMGILEVYVKEDLANEIVILKNDIEKTIKSKVKSILERHTYQNNKELQGLTQAADEIITNILDEKEVIEKVFDIKSVKFNLKGHEQLKINDLNQLLQVKHYYEENARKREIMKEHPERYTVLKVHDSYDSKNEPVENDDIEKLDQEEITYDNY